jgi:hypothetical protein
MITQILKNIRARYIFKKGYRVFKKTGQTTPAAYAAMRQMFVNTRGASNDALSEMINHEIGEYNDIGPKGVLGDLSNEDLEKMVGAMRKDGYYIFEKKLPQDLVKELYEYGLTIPCHYLDVDKNDYSEDKLIFNPEVPISPRYQFSNEDIVNLPVIQKLLFDQSLLAFAQKYLGSKPILDLIAFWWSLPFGGKGKSAAAQMYHFDMDRIKFMKFFFYLTDVDTNTGPHCYVKGSHCKLPKELSRDGRFTDEEIEQTYGAENLIEICGKKGTIMAVDTRGFHKGKELLQGTRLLFQIEFSNSMFGQKYPPTSIKYINENTLEQALKYPYTYGQILIQQN